MTVETQQNHNRLIGGKNGMTANNLPSSNNSNGLKKTVTSQQKHEEYKRMTENTMSVCNVNLMENNLASRYVRVLTFGLRAEIYVINIFNWGKKNICGGCFSFHSLSLFYLFLNSMHIVAVNCAMIHYANKLFAT